MSVVSNCYFESAIAAAAYLNSLRAYRAVLWMWSADSESWIRITHHSHVTVLRTVAQVNPTKVYLISDEYVDIKGRIYDVSGERLGDQPVKGMLRESHKVQWINPQGPDPFPWLHVSDIEGATCNAPFGIPAGWVQNVITVTSTLVVPAAAAEEEEEEEEAEEMDHDGM